MRKVSCLMIAKTALLIPLHARESYELLHARSGEIIQILGIYGRLRAIRLRAECLHSISLVPLEMARGCLGQHVAVRIEGVGEGQWPSSDGPQPVAALLNREIAQVS